MFCKVRTGIFERGKNSAIFVIGKMTMGGRVTIAQPRYLCTKRVAEIPGKNATRLKNDGHLS